MPKTPAKKTEPRRRLSAYVDARLLREVKIAAVETDITVSELVAEALRTFLDKRRR